METITIQVEGMSCQHCAKAVEGALNALDGVENAKVSLEKGSVEVQFNSGKVNRDTMKAAIEGQGYDVP